MKRHIGTLWTIVAAVTVIAIGTTASRGDADAAPSPDAPMHLRLLRSEPSAHETLSVVPKGIHLWFSEPAEIAVTSVKLMKADSTAVTVGAAHAGDTRPHGNPTVSASIQKSLTPGRYDVSWRTTSKDGHAVKGSFAFVIKAGARESH